MVRKLSDMLCKNLEDSMRRQNIIQHTQGTCNTADTADEVTKLERIREKYGSIT